MSVTTNLALNEPAYNSTSPTWDQPLNYNATILDQMFGNTTSVSVSTSSTPTYTNIAAPSATAAGSTSQAMRFSLTGALAANQTVLLPQGVAGMWSVTNFTSGAFTITLGSNNGSNAAAGATVSCPQGYSTLVFCDSINVFKADDGLTASGIVSSFSAGSTGLTPSSATTGSVTLGGILSVPNGGTGTGNLPGGVLIGNGTSAITSLAPSTSGNVLTSNGSSWVSQAPVASGLGVNQTWQSVTRVNGTTYTNSTGSPIAGQAAFTGGGAFGASITVGGVNILNLSNGGGGGNLYATYIVPAGSTYVISYGSPSSTIFELR